MALVKILATRIMCDGIYCDYVRDFYADANTATLETVANYFAWYLLYTDKNTYSFCCETCKEEFEVPEGEVVLINDETGEPLE